MEDFEQVVVVPAGHVSFDLDADLGGGLLFQEVQRETANDRQILDGMPHPDAAVVFPKDDVQDPVEAVLDTPVQADGLGEFPGIGQAAEEGTRFDRDLVPDMAFPFDQGDTLSPVQRSSSSSHVR